MIGMLLLFPAACAQRAERVKIPHPEPATDMPAPLPEPEICWPDHPVTPQSERAREVREQRTPDLGREFMRASVTLGSPIFIRIFKKSSELELWAERNGAFILFKTYAIARFSGTLGPKVLEGDMQAPEGFYYVFPSMMNPNSRFHLSFNIGYPNRYDRKKARTGSAIMVHGSEVSVGCFAMTDRFIEEIYTIADYALNAGQPFFRVHIFPFRMTEANMWAHGESPHVSFWKNLKEGYDFFEQRLRPPNVRVIGRDYVFEPEAPKPQESPLSSRSCFNTGRTINVNESFTHFR